MTRIFTHITLPALLLGVMALPIAAQAGQNPNINGRYRDQEQRIYSGVRHDQLSPREYARLQGREVRLRQQEAFDRRHDHGDLTRYQHARLEREENADSRAIYRLKHDGPGR